MYFRFWASNAEMYLNTFVFSGLKKEIQNIYLDKKRKCEFLTGGNGTANN